MVDPFVMRSEIGVVSCEYSWTVAQVVYFKEKFINE